MVYDNASQILHLKALLRLFLENSKQNGPHQQRLDNLLGQLYQLLECAGCKGNAANAHSMRVPQKVYKNIASLQKIGRLEFIMSQPTFNGSGIEMEFDFFML